MSSLLPYLDCSCGLHLRFSFESKVFVSHLFHGSCSSYSLMTNLLLAFAFSSSSGVALGLASICALFEACIYFWISLLQVVSFSETCFLYWLYTTNWILASFASYLSCAMLTNLPSLVYLSSKTPLLLVNLPTDPVSIISLQNFFWHSDLFQAPLSFQFHQPKVWTFSFFCLFTFV